MNGPQASGGGADLIVIGCSWGGLDALRPLLGALPADLDAAVVVGQHRGPESHPTAFRDLLGAATLLTVCEVEDKQPLKRATVFIAPPDYHTLVEGDHLALTTEGPVAYSRPSIDVMFESAAESLRDRVVGVVLTGANDDGARGLARVLELGGTGVVQEPDEAERPEMPRAAAAAAPAAAVLPLAEIPGALVELCGTGKVTA